MKRLSNEVKIGITFIIAIVLLYFGINFLKGRSTLAKESTYYVVYNQISGLTPSAIINNNGYKVGNVTDIIYDFNAPNHIVVKLSINKALRIPHGSQIYLVSELLGGVSMDLRLASNTKYYEAGDTIQAGVARGLTGQIEDEMLPQLNSMLPKIDSLVSALHTIASNPAIATTLSNAAEVSAKLSDMADEMNRLLNREIPSLVTHLNKTSENMEQITTQLSTIDYVETIAQVDSTINNLQQLSEIMLSDESTVGRLLNDTAFYNNLNSVFTNANALIEDIKLHPSRYINISVFGRK
ncbi:MAG: MCE family protein [Bacteroidaceae bacterium]|nr:MCE family protein [Bacteroidaceae bacterium]